jgi:hypothetical protein
MGAIASKNAVKLSNPTKNRNPIHVNAAGFAV